MSTNVPSSDLVIKAVLPVETNFTPGETSDVSWISTEVVDNEMDVVIASGIDTEEVFNRNPVVMACHDYQKWPVGTCTWIKTQKGGNGKNKFVGLVAKTMYDEDPDAQRLFGMIKRRVVRGKSIGFRPPHDMKPGEWGPPTKEELKAHPEWELARRIIRRCVLIEYSVVPIPMNQDSLSIEVSKGLLLPSYFQSFAPKGITMSIESKAKPDPETVEEDKDDGKAKGKDKPADDKPDAPMFKAGHYVEYGKGMSAGCGKIVSIHKGKVPGVDDDVEGSDDSPAAKVKVYKEDASSGKFRPTDKHVGKMCKDLSMVPHPLDDNDGDEAESKAFILPPHRTLKQIEADAEAKAKALLAASVSATKAAEEAADRVAGVI